MDEHVNSPPVLSFTNASSLKGHKAFGFGLIATTALSCCCRCHVNAQRGTHPLVGHADDPGVAADHQEDEAEQRHVPSAKAQTKR